MPGTFTLFVLRSTLTLGALVIAGALSSCEASDGNVDDNLFVCRNQDECGDKMKCGAGPGCFCVCMAQEQTPNTACADPNCQNPQTTE